MSYSIEMITKMFELHSEVKSLDFPTFMKRINEFAAASAPPKWANVVVSNSSASTPSPPASVSEEEEEVITKLPSKTDKVLDFIFTLPTSWITTTWVLLRNYYLTNPSFFRLIGEGHISNGDTDPHITVRAEIPIIHSRTGKPMKTWDTALHFYYIEVPGNKRKYSIVTMMTDGESSEVASYHP
jgi:hypothetical protein